MLIIYKLKNAGAVKISLYKTTLEVLFALLQMVEKEEENKEIFAWLLMNYTHEIYLEIISLMPKFILYTKIRVII